jgi:hypothetical protein
MQMEMQLTLTTWLTCGRARLGKVSVEHSQLDQMGPALISISFCLFVVVAATSRSCHNLNAYTSSYRNHHGETYPSFLLLLSAARQKPQIVLHR